MSSILDKAKIKIKPRNEKKLLALVTLNWNNEFEVRYFRITRRDNGTLWFQPPALKNQGYAKCFGVIDTKDWHRLEERVLDEFAKSVKESGIYSKEFVTGIERANLKEDINPNEVSL